MSDQKLSDDERALIVDAYDHEADAHCWQDHCEDGLWHAVEQIVAARVAAADDEVARLHTWPGLLSLLDEHWPEDTFPTLADDAARDTGPRLVAALRRAAKAEALVEAGLALADEADVRVTAPGFPVKGWVDTNSIRAVLGGAK